MLQLMRKFRSRVYLCNLSLLVLEEFRFCTVSNCFMFFADIAVKLGYDELDSVTTEDLALEVKMQNISL